MSFRDISSLIDQQTSPTLMQSDHALLCCYYVRMFDFIHMLLSFSTLQYKKRILMAIIWYQNFVTTFFYTKLISDNSSISRARVRGDYPIAWLAGAKFTKSLPSHFELNENFTIVMNLCTSHDRCILVLWAKCYSGVNKTDFSSNLNWIEKCWYNGPVWPKFLRLVEGVVKNLNLDNCAYHMLISHDEKTLDRYVKVRGCRAL